MTSSNRSHIPSVDERRAETPSSRTDADPTERALTSVGECAYEWDIASDALLWNSGAHRLLGTGRADTLDTGRQYRSLLCPQSKSSREDAIASSDVPDTGEGVFYQVQYALSANALGAESDLWVEDSGRWYAGTDGNPASARGVMRIINERRRMEEQMNRLARFDPLTGLLNRAHLNMSLEDTFCRLRETGGESAFMLIGIEHFELINQVYGHECGDYVIADVARRLRSNLRDIDIVGRFSGAKIGIIMPECDDGGMRIAGHRVFNMLREDVVRTPSGAVAVAVSVGGVIIPRHARDTPSALVAAHQAMSESREARESCVVSYRRDARRDDEARKAARMAQRIVTALKEGRVHLAFQPVVNAQDGSTAFQEALIRIEEEDGSSLVANDFVATAEQLGLVRLVDHHALDLALAALVESPNVSLSLNVSNDTAADPEWLAKLAGFLGLNAGVAERLIIEITESQAAESMEEARGFIDDVHALGCRVALDDFGAGFTSFRNLKSLPFDIIKIDGQFTENLLESRENQSFIRALVDLARLFDAKTVVEWVEDHATSDLLAGWGVDYLQGFHHGKPTREPESVTSEVIAERGAERCAEPLPIAV